MNQWEQKIRNEEAKEHIKTSIKGAYTVIGYISEDAMLSDFMTWAKNTYPQLRQAIFHIENEGDSSSEQARFRGAQSLSKGKLKGVFDVCCVYKGYTLWFEFKLPGGRWSPSQLELKELWSSWGIEIHEITRFEQWEFYIKSIVENGS